MTLAEAEKDLYTFTEDEKDGEDLLSTPHVTISRTRRAKNQEHPVAPLSHENSPTMGRRRPASGETPQKNRSRRNWSNEECETLKSMCTGKSEALDERGSIFWEGVRARIPGRTEAACKAKWRYMQVGKSHHKREIAAHSTSRRNWSREELTKLGHFRPRPGKPTNWVKAAAQFYGRTAESCIRQFRGRFGDPYAYLEARSEAHSSSFTVTAAGEISEELVKGNMTAEEREGDTERSSNEANPSVPRS